MICSIALVVPFLSLLSTTWAATINARQHGCAFVCPGVDLKGDALSTSAPGVANITCTYVGNSPNSCTYDSHTGALISGGNCPGQAVEQCNAPRAPALKRSDSTWNPPPSSSGPSPYEPSPSSYKPSPPSYQPSSYPSKPSSYPWKPDTPPPSQPPCNFRCPQQDLAKNPLTDEAFRNPYLFCSFSTPSCKTCSFCKYSTDTGLLLEDNDDGNCPKNAPAARPWDRRYD